MTSWVPKGLLVLEPDIATGHRSDMKKAGLTYHQLIFNAQWIPNGGDGWMLLMEFKPGNDTVEVKTFSPHLGLWRTGSEFNYTLKLAADEYAGADKQLRNGRSQQSPAGDVLKAAPEE